MTIDDRLTQKSAGRPCGIILIIGVILGFIAIAIIGILSAIAVPAFVRARTGARVTMTETQADDLSRAIEAYSIDADRIPENIHQLTTPVSYLSPVPNDVFTKEETPFQYRDVEIIDDDTSRRYWVLWSIGPDGQTNFDPSTIEDRLSEHPDTPQAAFADVTYDATNGANSPGDIIRVGTGK